MLSGDQNCDLGRGHAQPLQIRKALTHHSVNSHPEGAWAAAPAPEEPANQGTELPVVRTRSVAQREGPRSTQLILSSVQGLGLRN